MLNPYTAIDILSLTVHVIILNMLLVCNIIFILSCAEDVFEALEGGVDVFDGSYPS